VQSGESRVAVQFKHGKKRRFRNPQKRPDVALKKIPILKKI
jgi:hypothetical protein